MNAKRRKNISQAIAFINYAKGKLEEAKDILETCAGEEEEYRDNMPESLQESEKAEKADEAVSNLEESTSTIEEVVDELDNQISELENAINSAESATE